uniref:Uncharacterized protein n=1 Tax=Wuchereria bancrofti TaxID=6293 RepID=A0A1I8EDS1_WUCBA
MIIIIKNDTKEVICDEKHWKIEHVRNPDILEEEGSVKEYEKHSEKIAAGVPNVENERLKGVDEAKNEEISHFTKDKIDILVLNHQNLPGEQIDCKIEEFKIEELVVMCIVSVIRLESYAYNSFRQNKAELSLLQM